MKLHEYKSQPMLPTKDVSMATPNILAGIMKKNLLAKVEQKEEEA